MPRFSGPADFALSCAAAVVILLVVVPVVLAWVVGELLCGAAVAGCGMTRDVVARILPARHVPDGVISDGKS